MAERGAEFSLAERRFLLLRDFLGCGEARGAPEDALMSMADAGVSLVCTGVSREFTGVLLECIIHSGVAQDHTPNSCGSRKGVG